MLSKLNTYVRNNKLPVIFILLGLVLSISASDLERICSFRYDGELINFKEVKVGDIFIPLNKKNADQKTLKYLALWEAMGGKLFISDDVRKEIERAMM